MRQKLLKLGTALLLMAGTPMVVHGQQPQTSIVTIPALDTDEGKTRETGGRRSGFSDEQIEALITPYQGLGIQSSQAIGFFLAIGDKEAAAIVADGVNRGIVNLYDPNDCAAVPHIKDAMMYIRTCNELRAMHGLSALNVDPTMMAISIVQTDAAKGMYGHAWMYNVSENLAWGGQIGLPMNQNFYGNPFDYWYTEESQRGYDNGHFINIIKPGYIVTGFACGNNNVIIPGSPAIFGQTFSSYPGASRVYTPDEFERLIDQYQGGTLSDSYEEEKVEGAHAMYRLYNPNSGEHFYTASQEERQTLMSYGWVYEGIGWYAPEDGGQPVYRLYSDWMGDHHYTMDPVERDALVEMGWTNEGIGWNSDPQRRVPLYRQYNPNAFSGSHNYTSDMVEHNNLVGMGWDDEGICWYAVK